MHISYAVVGLLACCRQGTFAWHACLCRIYLAEHTSTCCRAVLAASEQCASGFRCVIHVSQ